MRDSYFSKCHGLTHYYYCIVSCLTSHVCCINSLFCADVLLNSILTNKQIGRSCGIFFSQTVDVLHTVNYHYSLLTTSSQPPARSQNNPFLISLQSCTTFSRIWLILQLILNRQLTINVQLCLSFQIFLNSLLTPNLQLLLYFPHATCRVDQI